MLTFLALLTGGPFRQLLPWVPTTPPAFAFAAVLAGWILFYNGFRQSPAPALGDPDTRTTRIVFSMFLAAGLLFRLFRLGDPPPFAGPDLAHVVADARNAMDLNQHLLFYPYGRREPLFTEWLAFIWSWAPEANGIPVVRIATAAMDAALLVVLYLLGREIGGRRLGLVVLGLAAVSKPLWLLGLLGCGNNSAALTTSTALLLTLRLLRRPDLLGFLFWGIGLGLGAYGYMPYRPWAPALGLAVLAWILWRRPADRPGLPFILLAASILAGTGFVFLERQHFLPRLELPLIMQARWFWPAWGWGSFLLSIGAAAAARRPGDRLASRWCLGFMVAALLTGPLALNIDYATHVTGISLLHRSGEFVPDPAALAQILATFPACARALFVDGLSDILYTMRENVFFDLMTVFGFLAGTAWLAARDRRLGIFLAGLIVLGVLPYVLGRSPYSPRLAAAVMPVLLVASLGILRLGESLAPLGNARHLLPAGWAALWLIQVGLYVPMMARWFSEDGPNTVLSRRIAQDRREAEVFLAPFDAAFYDPLTQNVLNDGTGARRLSSQGNLLFGKNEGGFSPVIILLSGRDTILKARLEREFPGASWSPVETTMPIEKPYAWRVVIPPEAIGSDPSRLLCGLASSPKRWRRTLFEGVFGLGRGLPSGMDEVDDWTTPLPTGTDIAVIEGCFQAGEEGRYRFRSDSEDPLVLRLDGKIVLEERNTFTPVKPARGSIRLSAGEHRLEAASYVRLGRRFPEIRVAGPTDATEKPLGR